MESKRRRRQVSRRRQGDAKAAKCARQARGGGEEARREALEHTREAREQVSAPLVPPSLSVGSRAQSVACAGVVPGMLRLPTEGVGNAFGSEPESSLGPPLPCTFRAPEYGAMVQCARLPLQDEKHTGGVLSSPQAVQDWQTFFGPRGEGHKFGDWAASSIAAGWCVQLSHTPLQTRLPPLRVLDARTQVATDALLRERISKNILEIIPKPDLPCDAPARTVFDVCMAKSHPRFRFPVPRTVYPYVHDLFILEKSTPGTWREICNAKELNDRYTVKHPSYIGGVHEARDIVRPGDILTAVDIRDAYPGVAIDPYFRNLFLLRHIFAGDTEPTWLRYSTMPFGAHDSARAYTRVLKPVCAYLRSKGLRIAKLLDDILLACSTPEQSLSHTQLLVDTLTRLHFTLARAKAEVVGEHRREFLGLVWDTLCMTTRLPPKRLLKIKTAATVTLAMLRAGTLTLRALAGMVG